MYIGFGEHCFRRGLTTSLGTPSLLEPVRQTLPVANQRHDLVSCVDLSLMQRGDGFDVRVCARVLPHLALRQCS